jgi:undecaprenyl pyrophosphate phosphatase UppP
VKVPALLRETTDPTPVLLGMASAAVFGFLAIRLLLAYVRSRDYKPFVYYRLAFSVLVFAVLLARRGNLG